MITGFLLTTLTVIAWVILAVLVIIGVSMLVAVVAAGAFVFIVPLLDVIIGIAFVVLAIRFIARRKGKKKK